MQSSDNVRHSYDNRYNDEVREAFNMAPVPGGEGRVFIRRLDTEPIDVTLGGGEDDETN